jgi:phenylalanyl-tRNA synthetase beta chain
MKFSVNWLGEFVDLPRNPEEIAELLTHAGIETKKIELRGAKLDDVVVSQITASSRHPNADRLSVCEVDDGSGTKRQIVCGATNYKTGDKVPLALPGAKLPNGTEIRKSKLRGVESHGMLCSPIELGLGEDASGLLILSPDAKVGAPIADLFPADTILEVEITPNRGDLLSHFGLAREIAALTRSSFQAPKAFGLENGAAGAAATWTERAEAERAGSERIRPPGGTGRKAAGPLDFARDEAVKIAAMRECPFFSLRKIENVKVGPSPQWLRARLESVGVRSINNIVDISNFVMLELGQPTHAFDADRLKGAINVRLAHGGERFLALDGKTYSLKPDNCVIADQERAVGIGGVMGGEETGVTESTKNVLLEAAYFLPASIRRTARELNLQSDASYRFERGVDPEMILRASQRAAELMVELAGANAAKEIHVTGELPANPADISLSYDKCSRLIGVAIEPKTVDGILAHFGLQKTAVTNESATWKIPTYRRDLRRDVDLIEEVLRAYGIEKIPGRTRGRFMATSAADRLHDLETMVLRQRLAASGLSEVRTSKLISRTAMASDQAIELRNPLSEDHVALRPNLISGLLDVLERNLRAGAQSVSFFEIGRVFLLSGNEERHLGILLCGNIETAANWRPQSKRNLDLFDLKGILQAIVPNLSFAPANRPSFALAIEIFSEDKGIGFGGQLSADKSTASDPVFIAELNLDRFPMGGSAKKFHELDRYPAITRDIAMIVPEKLTHAEILRAIQTPSEPLLEEVQLFDLFTTKDGIGSITSGKSLAYRLTYRAKNRTLTSEEVNAAHAKIRERLKRELGVALRE